MKQQHIYRDETFVRDSLLAGSLAIGGVTSVIASHLGEEGAESSLANILRLRITDRQPHLDVISASEVEKVIGNDRYWEILDDFRKSGDLDEDDVGWLSPLDVRARYVVFARIVGDAIDGRNSPSEVLVRGQWVVNAVRYESTREVTVSFLVLDLHVGLTVWRGQLSTAKSTTREVPYDEDDDVDGRLLTEALAAVFGSGDDSYPEPPETRVLLKLICDDFASSLPAGDGG